MKSRADLDIAIEPLPAEFPNEQRVQKLAQKGLSVISEMPGLSLPLFLQIILVDDVQMRQINLEHRGKDSTTDVLSFPLHDIDPDSPRGSEPQPTPDGMVHLGDLIISVPTCISQSDVAGNSVDDEFLRLMTHGLLHLIGYDHEDSEEQARQMREKEDWVMDRIDPFL